MTLEELSKTAGFPKLDSLKKKLRRAGMEVPGAYVSLDKETLEFLQGRAGSGANSGDKPNQDYFPTKKENVWERALKSPVFGLLDNIRKVDWQKTLPILPLPMLGLAASWGVFHFAAHFVPVPVAIIEAGGFELIYIGLAVSKGLPENLYSMAKKISWGAVGVSVVYNSISAGLWILADGSISDAAKLVKGLPVALFWILAIVHGAPLAILGYFVADLNFKKKRGQ